MVKSEGIGAYEVAVSSPDLYFEVWNYGSTSCRRGRPEPHGGCSGSAVERLLDDGRSGVIILTIAVARKARSGLWTDAGMDWRAPVSSVRIIRHD